MFLYIFLDEAGNFDFSPTGTKYFVLTSLTKQRPFRTYKPLTELKYDLIERGIDLEYFHAAEDSQATRDKVFEIISNHLTEVSLDSLIVEKRKTDPPFQSESRFYPEMFGRLLRHVFKRIDLQKVGQILIITDQIPIQRKREAIEKALKNILAEVLPENIPYRVLHHGAKSNLDLQIVDYCSWAIYRKWARGDTRSYHKISRAIEGEWEIFQTGEVGSD